MQKKFIAGIYNYCDRWCERCSFTSHCRNYNNTGKLKPEEIDINNKKFWKHLSSNFEKAIELLHKMAAEKGIDLDNISQEETEEFEQRQSIIKNKVKNHTLIKLCKEYENTSMSFLKKQVSGELVNKTKELVSQLHIGMKTEEDVVYTMADLGDCEEIIRWYLFFINAKLQRALHGKIDEITVQQENGYQKDSDGSAKIAISAMERSMGAWLKMYELLPSSEDVLLKMLSLLSQLKQKTLDEFPHAINFKRPGFDD